MIRWSITAFGGGLGLILAWGMLSGDTQGHVNLFYLLLIYLLIPVVGFLLGLISLLSKPAFSIVSMLLKAPLWQQQHKVHIHQLEQQGLFRYYLVIQSQMAAVAFSIASLAVFFMLLLFSDINIVWRSSLLTPELLLPSMQVIAWPWSFWSAAQPSLELINLTQDYRALNESTSPLNYAAWWPFVVATVFCYGIGMRLLLILIALGLYQRRKKADFTHQLSSEIDLRVQPKAAVEQAATVSEIPHWLAINNWANIELALIGAQQPKLKMDTVFNAGPSASDTERAHALRWQGEQLVLVKSWEPPMGELADFLEGKSGIIWPLDWHDNQLQPVKPHHLQEWRRFVSKINGWTVFLPAEYQQDPLL